MQYFKEFNDSERLSLKEFIGFNEKSAREYMKITADLCGHKKFVIESVFEHLRMNYDFYLQPGDKDVIKQCLNISSKFKNMSISKIDCHDNFVNKTMENIVNDSDSTSLHQTNPRKRNAPEDLVKAPPNSVVNIKTINKSSVKDEHTNMQVVKKEIPQGKVINVGSEVFNNDQKFELTDSDKCWGKLLILSSSLVNNKKGALLLHCNSAFSIGSLSKNQLIINDKNVSALLARLVIEASNKETYLEIHGDKAFVFLNDKWIKKGHKIVVKSGDYILINSESNSYAFVVMKNNLLQEYQPPESLNFIINIPEYALRNFKYFPLESDHSLMSNNETELPCLPTNIENIKTQLANILNENNNSNPNRNNSEMLEIAQNILLKGEKDTQQLRVKLVNDVISKDTQFYSFDLTKFDNVFINDNSISSERPKLIIGEYVKVTYVAQGCNPEIIGKIGIVALLFDDITNTNTNMVGVIFNEKLENAFVLSAKGNLSSELSLVFCHSKYLNVIKSEEDLENDINVLFIRLNHCFSDCIKPTVIYFKHIDAIGSNKGVCDCLETLSECNYRNVVLIGDVCVTVNKEEKMNKAIGFLSGPIATKEQISAYHILRQLPKRVRHNSDIESNQDEEIFTYVLELHEPSLMVERNAFRKYVNNFNKSILQNELGDQFNRNIEDYATKHNIKLTYDTTVDLRSLFGGKEISDNLFMKIIHAAVSQRIKLLRAGFSKTVNHINLRYEDIANGIELYNYKLGKKFAFKLSELNPYEEILLNNVKSQEDNKVLFKDVGGLENIKSIFLQSVILPIINNKHTDNVLLFGPPGTGKTLISLAVAQSCKANILTINPSYIYDKWLGNTERFAKAIFTIARKVQPVVVFIDEIDAILSSRSESTHSCEVNVVGIFLQELDGVLSDKDNQIAFIFATNHISALDPAFLRRIGKHLHYVGLPDKSSRHEILLACLRNHSIPLSSTLLARQYTNNDDQVNQAMQILYETNMLKSLLTDKVSVQDVVNKKCLDQGNPSFARRKKIDIQNEKSMLLDVLSKIINNKEIVEQINLDLNMLNEVSLSTDKYSGSDINVLCLEVEKSLKDEVIFSNKKPNELVWQDYRNYIGRGDKPNIRAVCIEDFNTALKTITPSVVNEEEFKDHRRDNNKSNFNMNII